MSKALFFTLSVLALFAITPAQAMECTKDEMTRISDKITKMPDGDSKTMAMKEMDMAGKMMNSKDMKGCTTHMDNATKAMEKK